MKTAEVQPEFLTVNQTAAMLQLSRPSVYQLFKERKLTPIKFGSSTRVRLSEIQNIR